MTKQTVLLAALFVAGMLLASDAALAQGYDGRYTSPYGPTLTPYLDYFRRDNGVLNSYYNFVRPKIRANYDMRQIDAQLQRQDEQQSKLARDIKT